MEKYIIIYPGKHSITLSNEDIDLARLYYNEYNIDRCSLGGKLERDGMGLKHYMFSGCYDRGEYINFILDQILPE